MKKCAIHKANGNFVEFGAELTIADADINLYAVWASTKISEKYTVTYDLDGGISTADKLIYPDIPHGEATPKIAEPTKTGYTFKGWIDKATSEEGSLAKKPVHPESMRRS